MSWCMFHNVGCQIRVFGRPEVSFRYVPAADHVISLGVYIKASWLELDGYTIVCIEHLAINLHMYTEEARL